MKSRAVLAGAAVLLAASALLFRGAPRQATAAGSPVPPTLNRAPGTEEEYAYGGAQFSQFLEDANRVTPGEDPDFYEWLDGALRASRFRDAAPDGASLADLLVARREALEVESDPAARTKAQVAFCEWSHRMVKGVIPRFSLDRGFEFFNTVRLGERQCFLQAVLIAGMLQEAGLDAGVAMVSRNTAGAETNNGHAVTLVKLADGTDMIVDASEHEAFARQRGLFLVVGGSYRYVAPVYGGAARRISAYRLAGSGQQVETERVRTLDANFLRSQFYFYRGERAPGGLVAARPTAAGLGASARYLRISTELCPENPLAVYSLARVYLKRRQGAQARPLFRQALDAYSRAGWVPQGARAMIAQYGGGRASAGG